MISRRILNVDPALPRDDRLGDAVRAIESGGVVAVPTETFYGLAVDPFEAGALHRLNSLKGKPHDSPALLLMADVGQTATVARDLPEIFGKLAERFWPGPLTLVVPAAGRLPADISGGRGTVAVRVPGLRLPRRLAQLLGRPITGVSANLHGAPPCRTATEVARAFPEGVDLILDGGASPGGAPSTILELTGSPPRVIRSGAVPPSSLRPFLADLGG